MAAGTTASRIQTWIMCSHGMRDSSNLQRCVFCHSVDLLDGSKDTTSLPRSLQREMPARDPCLDHGVRPVVH